MPGLFADYPAPVVRNEDGEREIVMMRCSCHHHGLVDTGSRTSGTSSPLAIVDH
jgi:hypothetical protein